MSSGVFRRAAATWIAVVIVMLSTKGQGQDAIRMSLAGEQAAAAERFNSLTNLYNLQAGPVFFRLQGEMGLELNDNVNYTQTSPRADLIFRPALNTAVLWPVTSQNALTLNVGFGYAYYLRTSSLDHLFVTPDSKLAFKVYSGDFVFDLHDNFSAVNNPVTSPTLSGTGNYYQLENTAGVGATWDLYKLILSLDCDYDVVDVLGGPFTDYDHSSELFKLRAAFEITPTDKIGVEVSGGVSSYDQAMLENYSYVSAGPFYESQLTPYLSLKVSAGLAAYSFTPTAYSDLRGYDSYYWLFSVSHQVNRWFNHGLAAGRQIQGGTPTSSLYVYDTIYYQANFYAVKDMFFGVHLAYDHGNASGGFAETFDLFGAGVSINRKFSRKITGTVSYDYWHKSSHVVNYSYLQDRLLLDMTYNF